MKGFILKNLIQFSGKNILFPFYHAVCDKPLPHIKHLYPIKNSEQFEREIQELLRFYQPIDVNDLLQHIQGEKVISKPSFLLSFDDGLRSCYDVIFPILEKYNIKAIFFLNSAFVDNKALFYRYKASLILNEIQSKNITSYNVSEIRNFNIHDESKIDAIAQELNIDFQQFLQNEKPYMTSQQITTLQNAGHFVGAHSVHHPFYADIDFNRQITETKDSLNFVKNKLSTPYNLFAFPFSDIAVTKDFFSEFPEMDAFFSIGGLENDVLKNVIRRLDMEQNASEVSDYLIRMHLRFLIKKAIGKAVFKR